MDKKKIKTYQPSIAPLESGHYKKASTDLLERIIELLILMFKSNLLNITR